MKAHFAAVLVLLFSAAAVAQVGPVKKPAAAKTAGKPRAPQEEAMEHMGPMMQTMMEGMYTAMFRVLAKPETASDLAAFTRNYYDALIRKGFTKEEAFKIVVGMGLPAVKGVQ